MGNEIDCNVFWMDPACMYPTEDMAAGTQGEAEDQPQLLPASVTGAWLYNLNQTVKSTTPLAARFQTSTVPAAPAIKTPTANEAFASAKKVVTNLYSDAGAYLDRLAHGRYVDGVDTLQVYLLEHYLRAVCTGRNPGSLLASVIAAFVGITGDDVDAARVASDVCSKFDSLPLGQNPELFAALKQVVDKEEASYAGGLFLNSLGASSYLLEALADDENTNFDFLDRFADDDSYNNILKPVFEKAYGLVEAAWQTANNTEGPQDIATLEALLPSFEGRSQLVGLGKPYDVSEKTIGLASQIDLTPENYTGEPGDSLFATGYKKPVRPADVSEAQWALAESIVKCRMLASIDSTLNSVGQFVLIGLGTVAATALAPESGGSSFAALSAAVTGGSLSAGLGLKEKWDLLQTARAYDLADAEDKLNGDKARKFAEDSYRFQQVAAVAEVVLSVAGAGTILKTGGGLAPEALVAGAEGLGGAAANENITNIKHVCDGQALETGNENCDYTTGDAAVKVLLAGGISAITAGLAEGGKKVLFEKSPVATGDSDLLVPTAAANNANHYADEIVGVAEAAANNNAHYSTEMDMPVLGTGTDGLPLSQADQPYAMADKPKGPIPQRPTRDRDADIRRIHAERRRASLPVSEPERVIPDEVPVSKHRPRTLLPAHGNRVLVEGDKVRIGDALYDVNVINAQSGRAGLSWTPEQSDDLDLVSWTVSHNLSNIKYDPINREWVLDYKPEKVAAKPVVTQQAPSPTPPTKSKAPLDEVLTFQRGDSVLVKNDTGTVDEGWTVVLVREDGSVDASRHVNGLVEYMSGLKPGVDVVNEKILNVPLGTEMWGLNPEAMDAAFMYPRRVSRVAVTDIFTPIDKVRELFSQAPSQNNVGNCWLVSIFNSMFQCDDFNLMMATSMKPIEGGYRVFFPLGKLGEKRSFVDVMTSELGINWNPNFFKRDKGGSLDLRMYLGAVRGDEGWQILEKAIEKNLDRSRDAMEGGYMDHAVLFMFENRAQLTRTNMTNVAKINDLLVRFDSKRDIFGLSSLPKPAKKGWFRLSFFVDDTTYQVGSHRFYYGHAYSLTGVTKDAQGNVTGVTVVNPHDAKTPINLSVEEYYQAFSWLMGGQINFSNMFHASE